MAYSYSEFWVDPSDDGYENVKDENAPPQDGDVEKMHFANGKQ